MEQGVEEQDKSSLIRWSKMIRKSGCRNLGVLKQIHGLLVIRGLKSNILALREFLLSVVNSLHGSMDYAYKLFDRIPEPDIFVWNTILKGAAHSSTPLDAIFLYSKMKERYVAPDSFTFLFLLKACTKLSSVFVGAQFHGMIIKLGLESDAFVRNSLINMYVNCGDLAVATALFKGRAEDDLVARSALIAGYAKRGKLGIAQALFDETHDKDLVSWNVMISGYAKQGDMEKARQLFDQAPEKDTVSWNSMIAGYVSCQSHAQALVVYEKMLQAGKSPDEATIVSLISSCADSGALEIGARIHHSLEMHSGSGSSIVLGNVLIDMYAKCGIIKRAMRVFKGMKERDVWTWNSIIGGFAFHGHPEEALNLFKEMRRARVKPNEITFVSVLAACSHGGKVEDGRKYFSMMKDEYGLEHNIKHYGCMVDLLGRAGLLEAAFQMINSMEIASNAIIWRSLLGACRIHGNVELGERANEELLKMSPDASGDYVLLSGIYASKEEWCGVERVRKLMDDKGVKKEAGCALIDPGQMK